MSNEKAEFLIQNAIIKKTQDSTLIIFGILKASSLAAHRSYYQFMNDVVEKVDNLINDMNEARLTEDELKKQEGFAYILSS